MNVIGSILIKNINEANIFLKTYNTFLDKYDCKFCFKYLNITIEFSEFNKFYNIGEYRTWVLLQFQYFLMYIVPINSPMTKFYYTPNYDLKKGIWFIPLSFVSDGLIYFDKVVFKSKAPDLNYYPIFAHNRKIFSTIVEDNDPNIIPYENPEIINWFVDTPGNKPVSIPGTTLISITFGSYDSVLCFTHYEILFLRNLLSKASGTLRYNEEGTLLPLEILYQAWSELGKMSINYTVQNQDSMWILPKCFKSNETNISSLCKLYTLKSLNNFGALAAKKTIVGNDYVWYKPSITSTSLNAFSEYFNTDNSNFYEGFYFDGVSLVKNENFSCYYQENKNINDNSQIVWPTTQKYETTFDVSQYEFLNFYYKNSQASPFTLGLMTSTSIIGYKNYYNFQKSTFDNKRYNYVPLNSRVTIIIKYHNNNYLQKYPAILGTIYSTTTTGYNFAKSYELNNAETKTKLDMINYSNYFAQSYPYPNAFYKWDIERRYTPFYDYVKKTYCYNDNAFDVGMRAIDLNYDFFYNCKQIILMSVVLKKSIQLNMQEQKLIFNLNSSLDLSQFKYYSLKFMPANNQTNFTTTGATEVLFNGAIFCNLSKINVLLIKNPITIMQCNSQYNDIHMLGNINLNRDLEIIIKNSYSHFLNYNYDCYLQLNFF